ncbi:MAG: response regulator [Archangium sp.]|nr:response regulator [Archangium sp.]
MSGGKKKQKSDQIALSVVDSALEGCQVISPEFRYVYVNDALLTMAKRTREQLIGKTMSECYPGIEHTEMYGLIKKCMSERTPQRMTNEFTYPDGSQAWFELRIVPVPEGVCVLSLDISEMRKQAINLERARDQLRQAQKMEAIGRLASGIAHDFNNLLSVVLNYSALLRDAVPSEFRADLDEIVMASERGAALTHQLLAFARVKPIALRVLDLGEVVAGLEPMLRRLLRESIEFSAHIDSNLWPIKADPGQLEQVLMNLVVNARDAMGSGGKLAVHVRNIELDDLHAELHFGMTPGAHVMLEVVDTGAGMDKATQERIFEPFFTTKAVGKGTGLGLATVFGIVQNLAGSIWVYSEPGKGTTFKLYFPRTSETAIPLVPLPPATRLTGTETVLVVEDEGPLRAVVCGILKRAGYTVVEATDGAAAISAVAGHDGPIHLLVSDVVMPKMNGRELADVLHEKLPKLKTLFMTGFTEDAALHQRLVSPGVALLQKPFKPAALLRRVRELLDLPVQ